MSQGTPRMVQIQKAFILACADGELRNFESVVEQLVGKVDAKRPEIARAITAFVKSGGATLFIRLNT